MAKKVKVRFTREHVLSLLGACLIIMIRGHMDINFNEQPPEGGES